ncbi:hypothetical protein [Corynebacterium heidelbergense]|uniref:Uncharacterized protein n=1 Tax=Corynebacterium heidelbergense TaxID=2055947 RepID=A0A364V8P3_9CORY|nr:hypothetical protein [Corynebacterium heidelbergense]RAV33030.1 hypothetical protein DLJ54_00735 [Corynebacterium heidelbergense]
MKPEIIDRDSGHHMWTAAECAEYAGMARGTFTSYAGRDRAPKPSARLHGLTLWDAEVIKEWKKGRDRTLKSDR